MTMMPDANIIGAVSPNLDPIRVTEQLANTEHLSGHTRALLDETDSEVRAGRVESALDLSLLVCSLEPSFVPNFLRTAELLVATNRTAAASRLVDTIRRLTELRGERGYDLPLSRIETHVDPTAENLRAFATRILGTSAPRQLDAYMPAAIDAAINEGQLSDALKLSELWVEDDGSGFCSTAYRVRELTRSRQFDKARKVVTEFAAKQTDNAPHADAIVIALAVEIAEESPTTWRAIARVTKLVRSGVTSLERFEEQLHFFTDALRHGSMGSIAVAVVAYQTGHHDQARSVLQLIAPADELQRYVVNAILARSAQELGDETSSLEALREAFEATFDPTVEPFAKSSGLLIPPASRSWLGLELAGALRQRQDISAATDVMTRLRQTRPDDPDVARFHAELMGQSGGRGAALRQLEQLLAQQEKQRNDTGAARTLEAMIRLAPGHLPLRNRLVDAYLRRGRNDEAIDQLIIQGRMLQQAGRVRDAFIPMRRGVEIATMIGNWVRVEQLFSLMIDFDPDDTGIRHSAVTTCVQYGKTDSALGLLREIVNMAMVKEDPDEAIAALHQMLALSPNEPSTFHRLGELLASIGEFGQAERVYRRLATLVPDDPAVRAKRSALAAMARPRV